MHIKKHFKMGWKDKHKTNVSDYFYVDDIWKGINGETLSLFVIFYSLRKMRFEAKKDTGT